MRGYSKKQLTGSLFIYSLISIGPLIFTETRIPANGVARHIKDSVTVVFFTLFIVRSGVFFWGFNRNARQNCAFRDGSQGTSVEASDLHSKEDSIALLRDVRIPGILLAHPHTG